MWWTVLHRRLLLQQSTTLRMILDIRVLTSNLVRLLKLWLHVCRWRCGYIAYPGQQLQQQFGGVQDLAAELLKV